MDIDVISKKLGELLAFKEKIETMIRDANGNADRASATIEEMIRFKAVVEGAMADIGKMTMDLAVTIDDVAKVKQDLAPVLEWIAAQKAAEAARQATSDGQTGGLESESAPATEQAEQPTLG